MKDLKVFLFGILLFVVTIALGGILILIISSLLGMAFSNSPVTKILLTTIFGIGSFILVLFLANKFNEPFNNYWDKIYNSK